MRIGVLGGTFDPIHNGHLAIAEEARLQVGLADVIFVPAGQPWFKVGNSVLSAEHRLQMVALAIADRPHCRISTVDISRGTATYTVDTISDLAEAVCGDFYFIVGWDNLSQMPRWREPQRLIRMCHLIAVPRPGVPRPDIGKVEQELPGISRRLVLLDRPEIDVSASEIRSRVARGLSISHLVPGPVAEYIAQQGLYRGQTVP